MSLHPDVSTSQLAVSRFTMSRRKALSLGGSIGIGAFLAACSSAADVGSQAASTGTATPAPASSSADIVAKLDSIGTCGLQTEEVSQGPYYFDVDTIRSDLREDRPGSRLDLAFRVWDADCAPVPNCVVEIWHCDAAGNYSGFESASLGADTGGSGAADSAPASVIAALSALPATPAIPATAPPGAPGGTPPSGAPPSGAPTPGGGPLPSAAPTAPAAPSAGSAGSDAGNEAQPTQPTSGETSNGSYSSGDVEATPTDAATYLRGAQVADSDGIVRFTTIWPGWSVGRTVHINLKVHINKRTVLTGQVGFDDNFTTGQVFTASPYSTHTGRDTFNGGTAGTGTDTGITTTDQLLTIDVTPAGYLAYINLGVGAV